MLAGLEIARYGSVANQIPGIERFYSRHRIVWYGRMFEKYVFSVKIKLSGWGQLPKLERVPDMKDGGTAPATISWTRCFLGAL